MTMQLVLTDPAALNIVREQFSDGAISTPNYAEDGSGNPIAGAKLDSTGTALKVASGNLQIGTFTLANLAQMVVSACVYGFGNGTFQLNGQRGITSMVRYDRGAGATPRYVLRFMQSVSAGQFWICQFGAGFSGGTVVYGADLSPGSGGYTWDVGLITAGGDWVDPNTTTFTLYVARYSGV
jgi:hypothetical protein